MLERAPVIRVDNPGTIALRVQRAESDHIRSREGRGRRCASVAVMFACELADADVRARWWRLEYCPTWTITMKPSQLPRVEKRGKAEQAVGRAGYRGFVCVFLAPFTCTS